MNIFSYELDLYAMNTIVLQKHPLVSSTPRAQVDPCNAEFENKRSTPNASGHLRASNGLR